MVAGVRNSREDGGDAFPVEGFRRKPCKLEGDQACVKEVWVSGEFKSEG